jgi:hypothetical protein
VRPRAAFGLIFLSVLATRLCHLRILWIEECYPAAGALQILYGKVPYRDFWFDKPPLSMATYLLWGAETGWPLRLAGALFITFVSWLLYRFACSKWGRQEGLNAAFLGAFFLTFGIPSAVMALAPDLLMLAPHIGAVYLAWRRRPFWSGLCAGIAMLIHTKAVYLLAACLLWQYRAIPSLAAGFLLPNMLFAGWLLAAGSFAQYWEQVWQWGFLYARDTFVEYPLREAFRRTLNWAGFHAALIIAALWCWATEKDCDNRKFAGWALISIAAISAGWRFFPRYYFQLLPVLTLFAARGVTLLGRKRALAVLALLLIPLLRFGPRYVELAGDLTANRPSAWSDLAMFQGSLETAHIVGRFAQPGDSLLVWGYRPDIHVLTRLPAGTPFLGSQPLTGVIADRHLMDDRSSAPDIGKSNRARLVRYFPTFVVDGLGPYNPDLAIGTFPDLGDWLERYEVVRRTSSSVVYRLARSSAFLDRPLYGVEHSIDERDRRFAGEPFRQ